MGKVSLADKMRIQTLREQRLGAKAIVAAYPEKNWAQPAYRYYALPTASYRPSYVPWPHTRRKHRFSSSEPSKMNEASNVSQLWGVKRTQTTDSRLPPLRSSLPDVGLTTNVSASQLEDLDATSSAQTRLNNGVLRDDDGWTNHAFDLRGDRRLNRQRRNKWSKNFDNRPHRTRMIFHGMGQCNMTTTSLEHCSRVPQSHCRRYWFFFCFLKRRRTDSQCLTVG